VLKKNFRGTGERVGLTDLTGQIARGEKGLFHFVSECSLINKKMICPFEKENRPSWPV